MTLRPSRAGRRDTGVILAATVFAAAAVLVFQATGTRTLGADDFAPIAVLWTLMFLLHTVLLMPAEQHLTRALAVTRVPAQIRAIQRDMLVASLGAMTIGVAFVYATLDRFFDGSAAYVAVIAAIVGARTIMVAARGLLAGSRRFVGYGASIGLESVSLVIGGVVVALLGGSAPMFAVVMVISPLATLASRPFRKVEVVVTRSATNAQPSSFLAWLILATASSQLIIAGGPIAVGFVGGSPAAVSIFFTSFALLRGPLTSAYNLVARVLPDFTALAHSAEPGRLWAWADRILVAGVAIGALGGLGAGVLLRLLVAAVYGAEFSPPLAAASLGGVGVGFGLAALFATQLYSAAAMGARLALGWAVSLVAALVVLLVVDLEPLVRVALAITVGEGVGLVMLSVVLRPRLSGSEPGPSSAWR